MTNADLVRIIREIERHAESIVDALLEIRPSDLADKTPAWRARVASMQAHARGILGDANDVICTCLIERARERGGSR